MIFLTVSLAAVLVPIVNAFSGEMTFYHLWANAPVSCQGLTVQDSDLGSSVAVPPGLMAGGSACGKCILVHGPKGTVVARVVDTCAGCPGYHDIDLSTDAFTKIADQSAGRIKNVQWEWTDCNGASSGSAQQKPLENSPEVAQAKAPNAENSQSRSSPAARSIVSESKQETPKTIPEVAATNRTVVPVPTAKNQAEVPSENIVSSIGEQDQFAYQRVASSADAPRFIGLSALTASVWLLV